jgi:uncharacterized membrane protein
MWLLLSDISPTFVRFPSPMTRSSPAYRLLAAGSALWCLAIVLPPLVRAFTGSGGAADALAAPFAAVCHQWDSHSLHLFGQKLAVCARCTAVYAGFLAGVLAAPSLRRRESTPLAWAVAAGPILADVLLDLAPGYSPGVASRLVTGGFFGVAAALLLTPIIVDAFGRRSPADAPQEQLRPHEHPEGTLA